MRQDRGNHAKIRRALQQKGYTVPENGIEYRVINMPMTAARNRVDDGGWYVTIDPPTPVRCETRIPGEGVADGSLLTGRSVVGLMVVIGMMREVNRGV